MILKVKPDIFNKNVGLYNFEMPYLLSLKSSFWGYICHGNEGNILDYFS